MSALALMFFAPCWLAGVGLSLAVLRGAWKGGAV